MLRLFHMAFAGTLAVAMLVGSLSATADDFSTDEQGREFRVSFDPGTRWALGAAAHFESDAGDSPLDTAAVFSHAFEVRVVSEYGAGDEYVRWQFDSGILLADVRPWSTGFGGAPALDATAYDGAYFRHAAEPYVTLPGNPPERLYFPFDIAFEVEAGHVLIEPAPLADFLRVDVLRGAVLLDSWRPDGVGDCLQLGVGPSYGLDLGKNPGGHIAVVHRVAPFSAFEARFRLQDDPGLTVFDAKAIVAPSWASVGGWGLELEGSLRFERILLAVNDEPLAFVAEANYRRLSDTEKTVDLVRATAGLSWMFQL